MITLQEWNAMSGKEQTMWLEDNCQVNGLGCPRKPLLCAGINDAPYRAQSIIDGKQVVCPAYRAWASLFTRAYSAKYHAKKPTYSGVTVCDEWHSFMSFREWWLENQTDGFDLDKDILSDAGFYSPETCIFVPAWINSFTVDCGAARGEYPIGVAFHKCTGKFRAQCRNPMSKKREYLGLFKTPEAAHAAWLNRKLELALELKPRMDEINPRIYQQVIEIINNAK